MQRSGTVHDLHGFNAHRDDLGDKAEDVLRSLAAFRKTRQFSIRHLGGAFASSRYQDFLDSMLYGVSALDPVTYGGVLVLILFVATTAALVPAWRASRIELLRVLREE